MRNITKKIYVPPRYLAFESVQKINIIAKPLFDRSPIDFLDHTRVFFDGTMFFFTTSSEITQYFFDLGIAFLPYLKVEEARSVMLLSSISPLQPYLSLIKEDLEIDHILAYVDKRESYVDVFWFAASTKKNDVINYYLNNIEKLKKYLAYYLEQSKPLIEEAEKNCLAIPADFKDDYDQAFKRLQLIKNDNAQSVNCLTMPSKCGSSAAITVRETECIKLLLKGYTAKMIATELAISSRTVETHLVHVKTKLGCRSRSELISHVFKIKRNIF